MTSTATAHRTRPCNATHCTQGQAPCPCPQACELPEGQGAGAFTAHSLAVSLLAHAAFTALSIAGLVIVVISAPGP